MKLILLFCSLAVACLAKEQTHLRYPMDFIVKARFRTPRRGRQFGGTISRNIDSAPADIEKFYKKKNESIPEYLAFKIDSPNDQMNREPLSTKAITVKTSDLMSAQGFLNGTDVKGNRVTFDYSNRELVVCTYWDKRRNKHYTIEDPDFFDRSTLRYLARQSGQFDKDGNNLPIKRCKLSGTVITENGDLLSSNLVKASKVTLSHYRKINEPLPKNLFIKIGEESEGECAETSGVFKLNWPEDGLRIPQQNSTKSQQSCKYVGSMVGRKSNKVRLEVCRFLTVYFETNETKKIYTDSNYKTRKNENLPDIEEKINNEETTQEIQAELDLTFVVDQNLINHFGSYKRVIFSIVQQANYYFNLPRFNEGKKVKLNINGIQTLDEKKSEIWSSKNDKKVLELLKIFVLKNEAFKENYDQENTDIVVFLRNKKTNNFATSNFKKKNVNKQSVAVVNFESIEESARLLAREVSHIIGVKNIGQQHGVKFGESPNVQYIMTGNKLYRDFNFTKVVDWSTSTQEQTENLLRFNEGLFANVSTTRLSVPKVFMSYEEQCRAIREGDDNKLYHFRGHLIQTPNRCKVLTCQKKIGSSKKKVYKQLVPLEGTDCGINSVCLNGYCRNKQSFDLLLESEWKEWTPVECDDCKVKKIERECIWNGQNSDDYFGCLGASERTVEDSQ